MSGAARRARPWAHLAVLAVLATMPVPLRAQEEAQGEGQNQERWGVAEGRQTYRIHCTGCHGEAGKGDGPVAENLARRPADLTQLKRRSSGVFPSERVFRIIEGRQQTRGHGRPPGWLAVLRERDAFREADEAEDAARLRRKLEEIVRFVESIQAE